MILSAHVYFFLQNKESVCGFPSRNKEGGRNSGQTRIIKKISWLMNCFLDLKRTSLGWSPWCVFYRVTKIKHGTETNFH